MKELEDRLHHLGHYAACFYARELREAWYRAVDIMQAEAQRAGVMLTFTLDST